MLRLAAVLVICALLWPSAITHAQAVCPIVPAPAATPEVPALCIDPQLMVAWNALVEPRPADAGVQMGITVQDAVRRHGTAIVLASLPEGVTALYRATDNTIRVSPLGMIEDRRVLAAALMHEITHLIQVRDQGLGGASDCVYMEARAFGFEAAFWLSYWGTGPRPVRTASERQLEHLVELLSTQGEPGLYTAVVETPGYQAQCALWTPTIAAQPAAGPIAAPPPTPTPAPPPGPTQLQLARCRQDAWEITMALAPWVNPKTDLKAVSDDLAAWCRRAVTEDGEAGLFCFEAANREALKSTQRGVFLDPKVVYRSCMSG